MGLKDRTSSKDTDSYHTMDNEIILYQPDTTLSLDVRVEKETVWLTQQQIAELFGTKRPAITKHLSNIFKSGELDEINTCSILEHVGNDGRQRYTTKYYNLDAILSVGYRVNSVNATKFRQWANKVLKEHLLRGYSVNQRLLYLESTIDHRFYEHERRLNELSGKVDFFVRTSLPPQEGIVFDGQIFDAHVLVCGLIKQAQKRIILIDNYIDETVLTLLDKRAPKVKATIYTEKISEQLKLDLCRHNSQYEPIEIKKARCKIHDRFMIIDKDLYHIGASIKDLGKRLFAFSKMGMSPDGVLSEI